jgi:hypothetical protein
MLQVYNTRNPVRSYCNNGSGNVLIYRRLRYRYHFFRGKRPEYDQRRNHLGQCIFFVSHPVLIGRTCLTLHPFQLIIRRSPPVLWQRRRSVRPQIPLHWQSRPIRRLRPCRRLLSDGSHA